MDKTALANGSLSVKDFSLKSVISNSEGAIKEDEVQKTLSSELAKRLGKLGYSVADGADAAIEGDFIKIDKGNKFVRYLTMGIGGAVQIEVQGKVTKAGSTLEEFNVTGKANSGSWITSVNWIASFAAKDAAKRIAKLFPRQ
jgi:hypothetical protein